MPIIVTPASSPQLVTWERAAVDVALYVPGCPEFEIEDKLKEKVREFFADSCCWRSDTVTVGSTVVDQQLYAVTPPTGARLNAVHAAWIGTEELEVLLPGERDDETPGERGTEFLIGVASGTQLYLNKPPAVAGRVLKAVLSWVPTSLAEGFLLDVFEDYRVALIMGTAGELKLQHNKPWSDPANHAGFEARFQEGIVQAAFHAGPRRRRTLRTTYPGI